MNIREARKLHNGDEVRVKGTGEIIKVLSINEHLSGYKGEPQRMAFVESGDTGHGHRDGLFHLVSRRRQMNLEQLKELGWQGKGRPLKLVKGAKECLRCGWCCKRCSCGHGKYVNAEWKCGNLVDNRDGTFSCGIHQGIIDLPPEEWIIIPAFGAGCCSPMNGDRKNLEKRLRNKD